MTHITLPGGGGGSTTTPSTVQLYDTLANRPAASLLGRTFEASDTGVMYYDTGLTWVAIVRGVAGGGTGATTAAGARTALGLVIGTNVQAHIAALDAVTGTNTGDQDLSPYAPIASPTFTGTVAGITKTMVGLSAVTNDAQLKAADLDIDSAFTANSDTKIPSQKAVKTALSPLNALQKLLAGNTVFISDFDTWRAGKYIPATKLNGAILAAATSATIYDLGVAATGPAFLVSIGGEIKWVTAGWGTTTWTLDGNLVGLMGTTSAAHADGSYVKRRKERHVLFGPAADSIWQGTNTNSNPFVDIATQGAGNALGGVCMEAWPLWRQSFIGNSASEWVFSGTYTPVVATTPNVTILSPYGVIQFSGGTGNFATWTRPARLRVQCIDIPWIDEGTTSAAWSYSIDGGAWIDNPVTSNFANRSYAIMVTRIRVDNPSTIAIRAANAAGTSKSFALPYTGIRTWSTYPTLGKTTGLAIHNFGWDGQTMRTALNARTCTDGVANGTTTVTSATLVVVAADVGSTVKIRDSAGAVVATTTVSSRTNATTMVLATSIPSGTALNITIFQGDHTQDVLRIMDGDPGSIRPDLTVLWCSPNDMGGASPTLGDNNPWAWANMIQYVIDRGVNYSNFLIMMPYEMGGSGNSGSAGAYQTLQAAYRAAGLAVATANSCRYLSLYDTFAQYGYTGYTAMNNAGYMFDTAHLAKKGQELVGEEFRKIMVFT